MKNFAKSKGKRITAVLLCAVMCIMSLPLSAFAFTAEEGKTVDAYYGDRYFGSDGDYYYSPESHQYIAYDENGNTSLHSASGVHRRTKLMIKDSSGSRQIMCIESGIDYNAGGTYSSVNGKNSSYFQNLPTTAQYGIMLTSVYGWRPGTTAPISGTNEDDFSMATQTILWEYQQQLRTSPTTLKANSYGVPADTYYMERDCQYKRCGSGNRLGTARFVFRSRYGKNLRFVFRCEETGTRTQAIYQVRSCQRCDHLRYGADTGAIQYRTRYNYNYYERRRLRLAAADNAPG